MAQKSRELTDSPDVKLPTAAARLAKSHPQLWEAYQRLGELISQAGPLAARERRLIHLAYALGSASEGAAHSHARRALGEGILPEELDHVALLAATTLGWPKAVRALTIVRDVTDPTEG
jgi:alkylhydroperoxidase/carboxymuconolactone decarboxylase family protein YurZ